MSASSRPTRWPIEGGDAATLAHRRLARLAQRLEAGGLGRVDLDGEADIAALDHDARDHAQADDVTAAPRVADGGQRRQHLLSRRLDHVEPPTRSPDISALCRDAHDRL
jgi:hypothetical protein